MGERRSTSSFGEIRLELLHRSQSIVNRVKSFNGNSIKYGTELLGGILEVDERAERKGVIEVRRLIEPYLPCPGEQWGNFGRQVLVDGH
jgi:hypothetical protein